MKWTLLTLFFLSFDTFGSADKQPWGFVFTCLAVWLRSDLLLCMICSCPPMFWRSAVPIGSFAIFSSPLKSSEPFMTLSSQEAYLESDVCEECSRCFSCRQGEHYGCECVTGCVKPRRAYCLEFTLPDTIVLQKRVTCTCSNAVNNKRLIMNNFKLHLNKMKVLLWNDGMLWSSQKASATDMSVFRRSRRLNCLMGSVRLEDGADARLLLSYKISLLADMGLARHFGFVVGIYWLFNL